MIQVVIFQKQKSRDDLINRLYDAETKEHQELQLASRSIPMSNLFNVSYFIENAPLEERVLIYNRKEIEHMKFVGEYKPIDREDEQTMSDAAFDRLVEEQE